MEDKKKMICANCPHFGKRSCAIRFIFGEPKCTAQIGSTYATNVTEPISPIKSNINNTETK